MATTSPIGIIGGSGLYSLPEHAEWMALTTPYGEPSDEVARGRLGDTDVAFLPRHGRSHAIPPHRINHRANVWGLHSLGAVRILAPCAVGSLRAEMAPGDVVICDQFIDRTASRLPSTFFDGPEVAHASMADPYCPELRELAVRACREAGFTAHERGTVTVVPGPRFSTRAESRLFRAEGGDLLNMTQYPEVALARELGCCYVAVCLVTDYDTGLAEQPDRPPVNQAEVMARFAQHTAELRGALAHLAAAAAAPRRCGCASLAAEPLAH